MTAYIIMHNVIFEDERDLGRIESPYKSGAVETIDFFFTCKDIRFCVIC
jgi:hypothetical protein